MAEPPHKFFRLFGDCISKLKLMYFVYILLNKVKTKTYTGVTTDVNKRLKEHNAGKVSSSLPYRPYEIIYTEAYNTLKEACAKERFYKTITGRRRLHELITKHKTSFLA